MEGADDVRLFTGLLRDSHLATFEEVPGLAAGYAADAGLEGLVAYLVDLEQESLRCWGPPRRDVPEVLRIEGTLAGRAFCDTELVAVADAAEGRRLWLPLLDGTERLGVLGLTTRRPAHEADQVAQRFASLVALLLVSKRSSSDTHSRVVRTRPMTLAAEVQRPLVPPSTFSNGSVVVSGVLEPAYEVGGDVFDYALAGDLAHLAVFDAMGHDLSAGLTSSIALGSYRMSRRWGAGPAAAAEAIDAAVRAQFGGERFVTGVVAELSLGDGWLTWVNRGHPSPLLVRGGRWVSSLDSPPALPMGIDLPGGYGPGETHVCRRRLQPGDELLLHTDGVVDWRSGPEGEPFGPRGLADFVARREADGLNPPETLRRLMHDVLHRQGRLRDDATVLLVAWGGDRARTLLP